MPRARPTSLAVLASLVACLTLASCGDDAAATRDTAPSSVPSGDPSELVEALDEAAPDGELTEARLLAMVEEDDADWPGNPWYAIRAMQLAESKLDGGGVYQFSHSPRGWAVKGMARGPLRKTFQISPDGTKILSEVWESDPPRELRKVLGEFISVPNALAFAVYEVESTYGDTSQLKVNYLVSDFAAGEVRLQIDGKRTYDISFNLEGGDLRVW